MNSKRDFAMHKARALVEIDPKAAYTFLLAAMGRRLDSATRREGNAALRKAGFGGNGRFRKVGEALSRAFSVLSKVGIVQDRALSAYWLSDDYGDWPIDIAFSNKEDPLSTEHITNSVLKFSWSKLRDGRFEIEAYLS